MACAPTEDSSPEEKDRLDHQLVAKIQSTLPHDIVLVLRDFNYVTGCNQTGYETVIGLLGSCSPNDTTHCLTLCAAEGVSVMSSVMGALTTIAGPGLQTVDVP